MTNKDAIYFLNLLQSKCDNGYEAQAIYLAVKALEPKPQGKWIDTGSKEEYWAEEYQCSICGAKDHWHNYCPNCGAKMEDEVENEDSN